MILKSRLNINIYIYEEFYSTRIMFILEQILYITYCSISYDAFSIYVPINNAVIKLSSVAFISRFELYFCTLKNTKQNFVVEMWYKS